MSSRAVRKLQRDNDLTNGLSELGGTLYEDNTGGRNKTFPSSDQSGSDAGSGNENAGVCVKSSVKNKKKKQAGRSIPGNLFSMVGYF